MKNIELGAGELGYLSNDYLLYHETQQLDRWNSKYAEFSEDVSNLSVDTPEQQALVDNIRASQQRLKDVFDNVASTLNDDRSSRMMQSTRLTSRSRGAGWPSRPGASSSMLPACHRCCRTRRTR